MPRSADLKANSLLAALPTAEWKRWSPQLERVQMPLGQVLYEAGDTLKYMYFPMTSIVSLLYVMENGASAEIAVVGKEGLVGVSLFMGGESTSSRAVVQSAGIEQPAVCYISARSALQPTGCLRFTAEDHHRNGSENARDL